MAQLNETQVQNVTNEILEHLMDPKNYGKMENPSAVGMGVDTKTGEFTIIYLQLENSVIKDIKHMCNACQDTVVAGSLFTEMIKGESIEYAKDAAKRLSIKIQDAPKKQQACSGMVLRAFEASLLHLESKLNDGDEDMCSLEVNESCEIEGEVDESK
jgi:nitrogen fixation NifU-like protein